MWCVHAESLYVCLSFLPVEFVLVHDCVCVSLFEGAVMFRKVEKIQLRYAKAQGN